VHGDGERLLGVFLADALEVELLFDLSGLRHLDERPLLAGLRGKFLVEDLFAELDAVVTDVNARAGDKLPDLRV
jgi:hypothetical protein